MYNCYKNANSGLTSLPNDNGTDIIYLKSNLLTTIPNDAFNLFADIEVISLGLGVRVRVRDRVRVRKP